MPHQARPRRRYRGRWPPPPRLPPHSGRDYRETMESMTTEPEIQPDTPPEPVERGRYAVFPTPDSGWAISRAGPLCDRCTGCGCGDQADPIMVPAFVVSM